MLRRHFALLFVLGIALAAACSDDGTGPKPPPPTATALRVTPQAPSLRLGESATLELEFVDKSGRPAAAPGTVTWSSSAPDIVGVDDAGDIAALATGTATIEARAGALTGATVVTVLSPAPVTGSSTPVSATIDTAGGTITATSADGTRYALHVPPHALREPTQITITPIAAIEHFPTAAGPSAAVLFQPDGLTFAIPAELTIVATAPFARGSAAFSQSSDGFALAPAHLSGDTAVLLIGHFSSSGTTEATPGEVAALAPRGGSPEDNALHAVLKELNRAADAEQHPDQSLIAQHLKTWFDSSVMPGLDAATEGPRDVEDAVGEWIRWLTTVQFWADGYLESEIDAGHPAAAAALSAAIDRLNEQCRAQNDISPVERVFHLAALAAFLGADEIEPSLAIDAIYARLCVDIAIEATLAEPFVQGSTLSVRAGLAVGDHPPSYDTPLDITLRSTTADLSRTSGMTNASGEFTAVVRLHGGDDEVVIEIEAVYPARPALRATRSITARPENPRIRVHGVHQSYNAWAKLSFSYDSIIEQYNEEMLLATGVLAGSASASLETDSLRASGHVEHESSVALGGADGLLVVHIADSTTATRWQHQYARGNARSDGWGGLSVTFEVLDEPVYYDLDARGGGTMGGYYKFELEALDPSGSYVIAGADWSEPDSVTASGWLPPGRYSLYTVTSVSRLPFISGEVVTGTAFSDFTFRLLERAP